MSEQVDPHPYAMLTPDRVLAALEQAGLQCDARFYPLNSYENRVYQVGMESGPPVVAKFYRPGRWSDDQIREEHRFAADLEELEIPVAVPLTLADGQTLQQDGVFRFAVFPRLQGRAPELDELDNLEVLGRYLGRFHQAGARGNFKHRRKLDAESMGLSARQFLLENDFIPGELIAAYESLTDNLMERILAAFSHLASLRTQRIHGDCHLGNVLWHEGVPFFVDLDDAVTGPAMQDLWMLLSGERDQRQAQLLEIASGYNEFADFPVRELILIEPLRTLRLMHYSAWLARRWDDPAFPLNFPWFNTQRYWSEHILELREQLAAMDEPPLQLLSWQS